MRTLAEGALGRAEIRISLSGRHEPQYWVVVRNHSCVPTRGCWQVLVFYFLLWVSECPLRSECFKLASSSGPDSKSALKAVRVSPWFLTCWAEWPTEWALPSAGPPPQAGSSLCLNSPAPRYPQDKVLFLGQNILSPPRPPILSHQRDKVSILKAPCSMSRNFSCY